MTAALRVDQARLWDSLMTHAQIGGTPDGGIGREALTEADRQGRDLFCDWARAEGAAVAWDDLRTIYTTWPGLDDSLLPIAFGSHLDTQATGGKFDGVLGVLGGLEVLRTLRGAGIRTRHPLCLVNWTAEEGGRFPVSMLASGVQAGVFPASDAGHWVDAAGVQFRGALRAIGYERAEPAGARKFRAWLELHIERGPVLEAAGAMIGVVTGGQAMRFATVSIAGRESHAGTTPMAARLDPVSAFVRIATSCEAAAGSTPDGRFTTGLIRTDPGSHSVVPRRLTFTLNLRHPLPWWHQPSPDRKYHAGSGRRRARCVAVRHSDTGCHLIKEQDPWPIDPAFDPVDTALVARFSDVATFLSVRQVKASTEIDVGLVGVHFDIGLNCRGRPREAPSTMRQASRIIRKVRPTTGVEPFRLCNVANIGDAPVNPLNKDESIAGIEAYFRNLQTLGIRPITIGGDHTIPTPILRGLAHHRPVGIVQIDSHADTLGTLMGTKITHATFMRRGLEEGLIDPKRVVHIGLRGSRFSADDIALAMRPGSPSSPLTNTRRWAAPQSSKRRAPPSAMGQPF